MCNFSAQNIGKKAQVSQSFKIQACGGYESLLEFEFIFTKDFLLEHFLFEEIGSVTLMIVFIVF